MILAFSSIEFLLYFLPLFLVLYDMTPVKYKNITLLLGSLVFYSFGEPFYLVLLVLSVTVNYFLGLAMTPGSRNKQKNRIILTLAIAANLGMLVFFKGGAAVLGTVTGGWPDRLAAAGLPLGISFYTFQMISYLIDVYRGESRREESFVRFATYVSMFPQLISGPIVKYGEVQANLKERDFNMANIQEGMKLFVMGLASKVLLADRVGILWQEAQTTGFASLSTAYAWLAAIAFSLNIYFDFCGYSLMAKGLGRILGFELPDNFRTPYMARSVRDFYRRWHITLGRWFCQYVYIPLGGNRKGELRTVCNLLAVWVLTSLWHGTSWNFCLWGGILWFCIVLERQAERLGWGQRLKVLPHLYVWLVIPVTWVCFAVTDFGELLTYLGRMFGLTQGVNVNAKDWLWALGDYWYLLLTAMLACTPFVKNVYRRLKDSWPGMAVLAVLFWICVWRLTLEEGNPFRYFNY